MRKLLTVFLLCAPIFSGAQVYIADGAANQYIYDQGIRSVNKAFVLPVGDTATLNLLFSTAYSTRRKDGATVVQSGTPYIFTNGAWRLFASGSGGSGTVTTINAPSFLTVTGNGTSTVTLSAPGTAGTVVQGNGTTIPMKTVNGNSLFGSGNINISGGGGSTDSNTFVTYTSLDLFNKKINPRRIYVKDFGAKQDRQYLPSASISGNVVTVSRPIISQADSGKYAKLIKVNNAPCIGRITSVISNYQFTISTSANIANAEIVWGTDDWAAYMAAVNYLETYDAQNRAGGTIVCGNSILVGNVNSNGRGLISFKAQNVESTDTFALAYTIAFEGEQPLRLGDYGYAAALPSPQQGAIVESFSLDSGSVFAPQTRQFQFGQANYIHLWFSDLIIRTVASSKMGGINGRALLGGLHLKNLAVDVDEGTADQTTPPTAIGISTPQYFNNTSSTADNVQVYGYDIGWWIDEHFTAGYIQAFANRIGLFTTINGHGAHIDKATVHGAKYAMYGAQGGNQLVIDQFQMERKPAATQAAWYNTEYDFYTTSGFAVTIGTFGVSPNGVGDCNPLIVDNMPADFKIRTFADCYHYSERTISRGGGTLQFTEFGENMKIANDAQTWSSTGSKTGAALRIPSNGASTMQIVEGGLFWRPIGAGQNLATSGKIVALYSPSGAINNYGIGTTPSTTSELGTLRIGSLATGNTPPDIVGRRKTVLTDANGQLSFGEASSSGQRLTTTQKNALTGVQEGDEVYDLTTHSKWFWNGTTWKEILSAP